MALVALNYEISGDRYDEAVAADGTVRQGWSTIDRLLASPSPAMLVEQRRQADRLLDAEGAGHLVHDLALERWADQRGVDAGDVTESRTWRLDPMPFVIDHEEFARLRAAVEQRMRLLESMLADLYGPRQLVAESIVPAELLFGLPGFRPALGTDLDVGRWLIHYAVDVVRDAAGRWSVVQDLTDAPAGLGYALLNRSVLARLLPAALRASGAAPLQGHADALRAALTAAAPAGRGSPRCVVLSAGPTHSTYVEHSYLATQLGYHLAEVDDLVMREGRLWLRALDGLEPIDVVYRRAEDAILDPLEPNHDGQGVGVPGIVWGARRCGVTLANAYGSALAEHGELRPMLEGVNDRLFGDRLQLGHLPSGAALATAPVFSIEAGALEPRSVVLRLHAVAGRDGITVMPGAIGRVLAAGDDPARPTARLVKDVWVVGGSRERRATITAGAPQVDFGSSVPKRAADALFWLGRAAERAEAAARCLGTVRAQLDQDPLLVSLADGGWAEGAIGLLIAAQGKPHVAAAPGQSQADQLTAEMAATADVIATQLATVVQEATSVREFLSTTTGRVLGRLARVRSDLVGRHPMADDLDVVLVDLAALAGMAMESIVRGPAWRFLDLGRRVERSLVVLATIEAALVARTDALAFQPLAEALLSSNESLVAYRRRYRSEVDLHAVIDILIHDDSNPRGVSFQLDRLREHVAALAWREGNELVQQASIGAILPVGAASAGPRHADVEALVLATRGPMLHLAEAISRHWFADPVHPTLMRGT